jgi:methylmalonyl-CoA/ethylmalonyl-CoA epimerase
MLKFRFGGQESMAINKFNFFGRDSQFNHIGLVVKSIPAVCPKCKWVRDSIQEVNVVFTEINGVVVELIEPLAENSPVSTSLRNGMKILHICYSVPDIEKALDECRSHGFHLLTKPVPARAFEMRRIAWVFQKDFGLFELVEEVQRLADK